ncbi:hypothetical protein QX249_11235 [Vibrio parahaemolyticus]|uniref:Uncharacterized protein n=1 Tax=Vibrio parahaemolyticus TaxID=670 RepID=A0AAW8PYF5_VIBPH|nr:hypothetical protein [Vibrio parahaemolyticus]MDS1821237.1 hypothetical protein [Vibrio parahaemolyticus]
MKINPVILQAIVAAAAKSSASPLEESLKAKLGADVSVVAIPVGEGHPLEAILSELAEKHQEHNVEVPQPIKDSLIAMVDKVINTALTNKTPVGIKSIDSVLDQIIVETLESKDGISIAYDNEEEAFVVIPDSIKNKCPCENCSQDRGEEESIQSAILKMYPYAKPASEGIKKGDVIVTHPDEKPILITRQNMGDFDNYETGFVIANVGEGFNEAA